MADKEKKAKASQDAEKNLNTPNSPETTSMEEKLKAAAGKITKAHASHRERNSELVKRRVKAEKESKARIEEAEKRREANEKHAQKVAEKKIAEFDYAQNYRKKLLKEREEAMSAAKQKKAFEREEAIREAKEARDQSVASYLEMERQEAKERGDRADALVTSVTKREIIDENGNKVLVDRFPQNTDDTAQAAEEAVDSVPAEEQIESVESAQSTEEVSDNENVVADESADAENSSEQSEDIPEEIAVEQSDASESEVAEQSAEPVSEESDNIVTVDHEPEEKSENESFEEIFNADNLIFNSGSDEKTEGGEPGASGNGGDGGNGDDGGNDGDESDGESYEDGKESFLDKCLGLLDRVRNGRRRSPDERDEAPTAADAYAINGEIVKSVKAEGAALDSASVSGLKAYAKHSENAIRSFESARREGIRALETNRDDRESPVILAGIIKICAKIVEIRCNNLETFTRVKAHKYIRDARIELHREIEKYNDYVVIFFSLTGEQLTRISVLLPENIAQGKSLAVIPELFYQESYVQTYPDQRAENDASAGIIPIVPAITADGLFGSRKTPRGAIGCIGYLGKARRVTAKLQKECNRITDLLYKTKVSRKLYRGELARLEMRTPVSERGSSKYRDQVFRISVKYGKRLTSVRTLKTMSAFARERRRLFVNLLALEREKTVVAYNALRAAYRVGNHSQRSAAERLFADALASYNKNVELCSRLTGANLSMIPAEIAEHVRRAGEEIEFPVVAYKRELVETVAGSSRVISMALRTDIIPNEEGYAESAGKVMGAGKMLGSSSLSDDSMLTDRASAIAKVMIDALKESAEMVVTVKEIDQFRVKSEKAIKYFKRALRASERAMSKAFDEDGVVAALVENLRVIANLIEVRRINISVAMKLDRKDLARADSRALYRNIELYNGRAIDYMSIVGEQFTRISTNTARELMNMADSLRTPVITYKENYIEVFPKDPLQDNTYEKPIQLRGGDYTPLLMKYFRLTENRAVMTSVVNAPFVFDDNIDEVPVKSWWHPVGFVQHLFVWFQPITAWFRRMGTNAVIWFIDESLLFTKEGLRGRTSRNERRIKKYESKLAKLIEQRRAKLLALETVVHDSDRSTASYQKQLKKINNRYNRRIYRLKMRWTGACTTRNKGRLLLEKLVLERERLIGLNRVLVKYRSYGRITLTPHVLVRYKRKFISAINDHNETARELAELTGVKFSEISSAVAEEIIRYGNMVKFPQIVCCREIIETIGGQQRTVGDRWHGYGLYTGATGTEAGNKNSPVMSVGAMGYSTDMGVPYFKADFDGMTMIGMTASGVPLIGFGKGDAAIPFTGTPMMLAGEDYSPVLYAGLEGQDGPLLGAVNATDPYSGIHSAAVDAKFVNRIEDEAKDAMSGNTTETPLDLEAKMIEERFSRALRARSMTTAHGVKTWWKLIGSEINLGIMRRLTLRPQGFLRVLLPPPDFYSEIVNQRIGVEESEMLEQIAKLSIIIDIECKRLYSATKVGIRRSQRVWSMWLHADIERYNELVREFNSKRKDRNEWIETLSLNIPDTIINRLEDRPPVPPVYSLRNKVRVDDEAQPISVEQIYAKLYTYAVDGGLRHLEGLARFVTRLITIPRIKRLNRRGKRIKALKLIERVHRRRQRAAERWRWYNEARHYRIRYEKGREMKRYNKRTLRVIGAATDPIKHQIKAAKVLRRYAAANFRIDYNMRIRQLIYRVLQVNNTFYVRSCAVVFAIVALALVFAVPAPYIQAIFGLAVLWVMLPIEVLMIQLFYEVILLIFSIFTVLTRNIWPIKYGARDVERNRYGAILECFVCDEYKILIACERMRRNPNSDSHKREFIDEINEYNKMVDKYSDILRVPIKKIEITYLLEKLTSGVNAELSELQNFVYVRELVERTDEHKIGKTLPERELKEIYGDLQSIIDTLNYSKARDDENFVQLQTAMQTLVDYIQRGDRPDENQRFELKRDLTGAIAKMSEYISPDKIEVFSRNVIKVVDQLGGRSRRKIIGVLGRDDMVI